jgi:hypothetical protein
LLGASSFADPTMTQTFFSHFNCRRVAETQWVLRKDYEYECWGDHTAWWLMAVVSGLGLLTISFGIPTYVGASMWRSWRKEMRLVRHEGKSRAVAHDDFHQQYSYIAVSTQ